MSSPIHIPRDFLPQDGRFGSGPSLVRDVQIQCLWDGNTTSPRDLNNTATPNGEISGGAATSSSRSKIGGPQIDPDMRALIMGTSHRQSPVKSVIAEVREMLSDLFRLPDGYEVVLGNGGSTAFWAIAVTSLIQRRSAHATFGEFGNKFYEEAARAPFLEAPVQFAAEAGSLARVQPHEGVDVYAWPHHETSTGVISDVVRVTTAQNSQSGEGEHGSQEDQRGHGSQDSHDAQDGHGSQDSHNTQRGHGSQDSQDTQRGHGSQDSHDTQDGHGSQDTQRGHGSQDSHDGQRPLMVVDATSIAGGVDVDVSETDAYYFAPQKCFGSDGGLWFALLSPAAQERARQLHADDSRWMPQFLDLSIAIDNSVKNQTLNTPALATLLMMREQLRWMLDLGGLPATANRSAQSSSLIYQWAEARDFTRPFVSDPAHRSPVVATIDFEGVDASLVAGHLRANGIVDIDPYRKLGRNQLRFGVFPAVDPADVQALLNCVDYVVERL